MTVNDINKNTTPTLNVLCLFKNNGGENFTDSVDHIQINKHPSSFSQSAQVREYRPWLLFI
jgi:hypothetical protein